MQRIRVFTDRYPLLGPFVWFLSIQYFIVQLTVSLAWKMPSYSWRNNTISDLGSTACHNIGQRAVCSPLHSLMNGSFILFGLTMAIGSLLIYQEFRERWPTLLGFSLMGIGGLGTVLVGIFPENTVPLMHTLGAGLPFLFGNISLIILASSLFKIGYGLRIYTLITGVVALIALGFFVTGHYGPLGIGDLERVVSYPQAIWLMSFGVYMSRNHFIASNQLQNYRRRRT